MRDIQQVLERWGAWSRQRLETDFSPIAAGFNGLLKESASPDSCCDDDAMIIDSCVGRLQQKRPDEHELLEDHYVKGIPKRGLARKHKVSEGMIRIKIQMAEGFIDGCLSMLNVRLEMDPYTERKNIIEPVK
ncbi:antitermination protein Q [Brenneria goodwinii]|uniref:Antitermination protein Q n=1 Tax=Brenneria goodwinii TaxID=1109412 RepID=A0AAE8JLV2_9GAMM|nr:antiterminator Q family protein [Brenneria goodwinii]ATA26793.1 antitermination protein Q [Brenneria goodwinii]RLM17132.1 antitermination protein Q [Brenneria goodwinii]